MNPEERAKAIRSNRRTYGTEPGTGYRRAPPRMATKPTQKPPAPPAAQRKSVGHSVRGGEFASAFKPPPGVILVAGIPVVAIGARLPGERRQKRKKR